MRPDYALSHLYDGEICIADLKDGNTRKVRWNKSDWSFYFIDPATPTICSFDEIKEWRLETITI